MREGLSVLKFLSAKGCVLVGDPGYNERFGFKSLPNMAVEGVPQEYILALPFDNCQAGGTVVLIVIVKIPFQSYVGY